MKVRKPYTQEFVDVPDIPIEAIDKELEVRAFQVFLALISDPNSNHDTHEELAFRAIDAAQNFNEAFYRHLNPVPFDSKSVTEDDRPSPEQDFEPLPW